jgi:hypothetical protein
MGSDFIFVGLSIPINKEPNWKVKITLNHIKAYCKNRFGEKYDPTNQDHDVKEELQSAIDDAKSAWLGERRDARCITYKKYKMKLLASGGISYGDSPTDLLESLDKLCESDLKMAIGFD